MKVYIYFLVICISLLTIEHIQAQDVKTILLHPLVGEEIDSLEKKQYHLFPYISGNGFHSAQIVLGADSSLTVVSTYLDNRIERTLINKEILESIRHYNFAASNVINTKEYKRTFASSFILLRIGYNFPYPSTIIQTERGYTNSVLKGKYVKKGSFGEGKTIAIGLGQNVNRFIKIELTLNYFSSKVFSFNDVIYDIDQGDDVYVEMNVEAKSLRLLPTICISDNYNLRKIGPVLKLAPIISVFNKITIDSFKRGISSREVESGGLNVGVYIATGIYFKLTSRLKLNATIDYFGIQYNPKKSKNERSGEEFKFSDDVLDTDRMVKLSKSYYMTSTGAYIGLLFSF